MYFIHFYKKPNNLILCSLALFVTGYVFLLARNLLRTELRSDLFKQLSTRMQVRRWAITGLTKPVLIWTNL